VGLVEIQYIVRLLCLVNIRFSFIVGDDDYSYLATSELMIELTSVKCFS
jgi:hypothetical protein